MEYIEWMSNLRQALDVIRKVAPEVDRTIRMKATLEQDQDLKIATISDEAWVSLQDTYLEVEPKLYQFNPEEEYGTVNVLWPEDMKGE